jgi:uncharacterized RDD family membrane protein YckC
VSTRAQAEGLVTMQGHYAGAISRFVAYVIDVALSSGLFSAGLAVVAYAAQVVTGQTIGWSRQDALVAVLFAAWEFLYFGYSWASGGKTFGMAVLGIQVVRADGMTIDPWRGVLRALVFPLSFLLFGLGFVGILVQREHRALHDLIAGTAVVYSWDARSARLRFLTRDTAARAASPADHPLRVTPGDRERASVDGGLPEEQWRGSR